MPLRSLLVGGLLLLASRSIALADTLDEVRQRGTLIWGADAEGGGPYIYADPNDPAKRIGFEVELAELLARELGVKEQFYQSDWGSLPSVLHRGQIDVVLNGYELTKDHTANMDATLPYYVYELILLARRDDDRLRDWSGLERAFGGRKPRVGVLGTSEALNFLRERYGKTAELVNYAGNTDAMREVETGKLDATVADNPVYVFYADRFARLGQVGAPAGRGYYAMFVRQADRRLREALNQALRRLIESGELRRVYERYGLWSPAQEELLKLARSGPTPDVARGTAVRGARAIARSGPLLLQAAWMTVKLAMCSMPIAVLLGLFVAIGRLYGPAPLRWLLVAYVEILRGTPLLLQLWFIFFVLPEVGLLIDAPYAAVAGLAINYSAYEAEIYRAGLQAIPRGQMEAALSLGMSQWLALRRIIVPQATRIVIPPVTNDFIALFKDTSVCSVITVVELTKQYSIEANNTGATLELAALTALLYLLMSVPLSHLAGRLEKRLARKPQ